MLNALPAPRPSRRLVALLLVLLACGGVGLASTPVPASAQLIQAPQTKEEARAAREANDAAADDGGSVPLVVWMGLASILVIGTAAYFILRDARVSAGPQDPRHAPARPVDPSTARGVPKAMFESEDSSAARGVARSKKREKGKRQKQARRANRPKR